MKLKDVESVESYGVFYGKCSLERAFARYFDSQKWEERPWYDTQQIGDTK